MAENISSTNKAPKERRKSRKTRQKPLLSFTQILILSALLITIAAGFNLSRRAQTYRLIESSEKRLEEQLIMETTRQVELQVTMEYVNSEDFVASYARDEGGQIFPGDRRIAPRIPTPQVAPTPIAQPTPDPAYHARPWQAWWRLFSDAPLPSR